MFRFLLILRHLIKYGVVLTLLLVFLAHSFVRDASRGRIYTDPHRVPTADVALVLGTSRYTRSGRTNQFFEARMDAATELIEAGAVRVLIVSGDNASAHYDEPGAMTEALTARGVPAERIVRDDAGLRTLDSVIRTNRVFGQDRIVIVSQRFHVERALFLARSYGIDAYGFVAADAGGVAQVSVRLREYAARVRAVLDVYVLGTEPRVLGDPIPIEFPAESTLQS